MLGRGGSSCNSCSLTPTLPPDGFIQLGVLAAGLGVERRSGSHPFGASVSKNKTEMRGTQLKIYLQRAGLCFIHLHLSHGTSHNSSGIASLGVAWGDSRPWDLYQLPLLHPKNTLSPQKPVWSLAPGALWLQATPARAQSSLMPGNTSAPLSTASPVLRVMPRVCRMNQHQPRVDVQVLASAPGWTVALTPSLLGRGPQTDS